jgi:hypothetical protein
VDSRVLAGLLGAIATFAAFGIVSLGFYASVGGLLMASGASLAIGAAAFFLAGIRSGSK